MTVQRWLGTIVTVSVLAAAGGVVGIAAGPQSGAAKDAAAVAAAKASPELVDSLSKELGASPAQAGAAAGALFGVAKSRMKPADFSQVAAAVPGMASLLKAAPQASAVAATSGALGQLAGAGGGLASAASAFSKLGLSPDLIAKAVPVLTSFVSKSGGASVGSLLASALK
jgi:Protein of unknown function VcgC/VcgE (DUF2780)